MFAKIKPTLMSAATAHPLLPQTKHCLHRIEFCARADTTGKNEIIFSNPGGCFVDLFNDSRRKGATFLGRESVAPTLI